MIGIIDYGMGNLLSVEKAFRAIGHPAAIVRTPEAMTDADRIVLPGVGAFGRAMENLARASFVDSLAAAVAAGKPLLGICLGLQLLFDESEEHGEHQGLGLIAGRVRRLPAGVKVPHMGWNQVRRTAETPLLSGVPDGAFFYFAQSYYAEPQDPAAAVATTDHGIRFASTVAEAKVFGVQFHPEKSQQWGLRLLGNFAELPC